jgi:hypothetical protein
VGGLVEGIKRRVENLAGITIARHASEGLASLHARVFLAIPDQPESTPATNSLNGADPQTTISLVGRSDQELAWLQRELNNSLADRGRPCAWITASLQGMDAAHSKTRARDAAQAAARADLTVLALPAESAPWPMELDFLRELETCSREHPAPHPPEVVVALTDTNRLDPPGEWAPPYDWPRGLKTKEFSIRQAVDLVARTMENEKFQGLPIPREHLVPVALIAPTPWNLDSLGKLLAEKAERARARAWHHWIRDAGKPGLSQLARQAKDAGKWLWKRL